MNLLVMINESVLDAKLALSRATGGNIVELSLNYLSVLANYRDKLYKLRGTPEINLHQSSLVERKLVEQVRKAIRAAVENVTSERNQTESLLQSFTSISVYEAAKTFNQLKYKGFDNWESCAGGVRIKHGAGEELLSVKDAVERAGLLRREAFVANKITF